MERHLDAGGRSMNERLAKLAELHGVERGYEDVFHKWQETTEGAMSAVLASMGVKTGSNAQIEASIAAHERESRRRVVPHVWVRRAANLREGIPIHLPGDALTHTLAWRIVEEDGDVREGEVEPLAQAFDLALPENLREGYHRIAILRGGAAIGEGVLIVAPDACYLPPSIAAGARIWGASLQLYGVRSERNAGIGDFTDLTAAVEAWAERGGGIVGTNPLHSLSLRDPGNASPYSPGSRLFVNPIYIDVEAVEDFRELGEHDAAFVRRWHDEKERLRAAALVDYAAVAAAKRAMLGKCHASFAKRHMAKGTRRARAFAQFRATRGQALRRHAVHEALEELHRAKWPQWPEDHRDPASEGTRRFAEEHAEDVAFHEYLQWQADIQLAAAHARARETGMTVGLYADLAISVAGDGSEAWANQGIYALGMNVGAPPDEFNPRGQDWGLPPLSPRRLRESAYAPFIATLRANMSRAGALRIDHVMGLERLYWIPRDAPAAEGAYVRYPVEDLLGIVALESHRHRCMVIGEDLGTVADSFREKVASAGVLTYRVMPFEREGEGFKRPAAYPRQALVSWSTHDLPTFAGWWQDEDLRTRAELGLLTPEELANQTQQRRGMRDRLGDALAREGLDRVEPWLAVQQFLAKTRACVMVVQMEDVFGVVPQANLPGTVDQHPNWRRKLPVPVEQWPRDARMRSLVRVLAAERGRSRSKREAPAGFDDAAIPRATYRVQLNADFTFRDATKLIAYLARLGVSHIYCSPFLKARKGSTHGYDIIDHNELNPEIGTREDFEAFVAELKRRGMSLMMDIVPNHMGVLAADNAWWQDVLENGPASACADFFDIDWQPPSESLQDRVLLPVLGDHYGLELAAGKLALEFESASGAFAVRYHEHRLPIDPREYPRILQVAVNALDAAGEELRHPAQSLRHLAEAFASLPPREVRDRPRMDERNLRKEVAKGRLASLARTHGEVGDAIARAVESFRGRSDDPASFDALHELLERQPYRLAYWRVAQDDINYRRFFDINDLAALRQENPAVFEETHRLILSLVKEGKVDALRVDHPDGLFDPRDYFRRLQAACPKPIYLVIEKIVAPFENLHEDWAVHGTTGYRFANVVNGLFVDPAAESRLTRTYNQFIGNEASFEEIARASRRMILRTALASELTVLTSRLARIARGDRNTRDFTFTTLRDGLADVIASFPVYRTYIDENLHPDDRRYIDWAVNRARSETLSADVSVFDFIRDALTMDLPARTPAVAASIRSFARKMQQLTSPVMAKGVEDTSFYRFNRLLSLNDVGGDPDEFGFPPAKFHRASAHRAKHWPHTMLATSTHDNKRSEDVRARIDVLTELAAGWRLQITKWNRMNEGKKAVVDEQPSPSRNDEYLLYQTLLGSFPAGNPRGEALAAYRERILAYMQKAGREAKLRTSWANANEAYEAATASFVAALLDDSQPNAFLDDFRTAAEVVTWIGYLNSLSMAAVKFTSPGVPDTYQGNETWDFSLVDPDNRRPVDYARRDRMLGEIERLGDAPGDRVRAIFANLDDGRAKLLVIRRLLRLRAEHEALFRNGGYHPIRTAGLRARHLIAFARRLEGAACITVAPRLIAGLGIRPRELPCGEIWGDTRVELPFVADGTGLVDAITGTAHRVENGGIRVAQLLGAASVAVLT
jgi:4-alpha-glucanotransferase/(1->4)-alpha-D-glucan 1-alpha-D-glucosylmutase